MAGSLLLPLVGRVAGKVADALVTKATFMWRVNDELEKLERQLLYVQSKLVDAEAQSETDRAVKRWTKNLRVVAYEAEHVLDVFQYEALRRLQVRKVFGCFHIRHTRPLFRCKASRKLKKVLEKINVLVEEMNRFDLNTRSETPQVEYRETHSALDYSAEIIGREEDMEAVVMMLLDQRDEHNVQVLPIIGMGGVGKTTLAKMVYNDKRVRDHFEKRMWHCVSQEKLDTCSILKSILELAKEKKCDLPDRIELLQEQLRQEIGLKRYLLILDDVWNEEQRKWEDDLKPLLCSSIGGSGSRIVVTSRNEKVASIEGTLPPYELKCLNEDDSWKLFSQKAFSNGVQEQADLVTAGKRIVKKCNGLPLGLKTMGGLMSSKQHISEWEDIAKSNLGATASGKDGILSILKLSYMQLPSEMKQCFAFCAVFPKDHEMEKDMLIQLWIANGFIQEDGTGDLEQKGESIFNYLVWRSFLQHVKILKTSRHFHVSKQESDGCKMHLLMHDLAKDVANECATAEELIQGKISIKEARHLKMSSSEGLRQLRQIRKLSKGAISFSTLLTPSTSYNNLMELKLGSSRALWCHCENPSMARSHFTYTAHLRYLDLSWSSIATLPSSVCKLYNLESLRLNNCYWLRYLPEGMTNMRKLRHIYLLGCVNLERMPTKLSLLQNLRTLTTYVVDTKDGCGIDELKDMRQLGNTMELYNLRKVKSGSKINLHEKYSLNELSLYWDRKGSITPRDENVRNDEEVLESLLPHKMLKILEVDGYGGHRIPQWMGDPDMFQCLRELVISNCPRCKDLPIVWLSSSLEHLSLSNMSRLTTICTNVDTCVPIFPKLRRIQLSDLPVLERWAENSAGEPIESVFFPLLEELSIYHCCKLAILSASPVLTHLTCISYSEECSVSMTMPMGYWPSLVRLKVGLLANMMIPPEDQPSQSRRPLENLQSLEVRGDNGFISAFSSSRVCQCFATLEELVISYCSNIVRWPLEELQCLARIRSLHISHCDGLGREGSSSEEILPLPQLKRLLIESCENLEVLPGLPASLEELDISRCRSLVALPSNLGNLAKLRELYVLGCDRLEGLPDGMKDLTSLEALTIEECPGIQEFSQGLLEWIPTLKRLTIWGCPELQRRCGQGGEYVSLVSSIPRRSIPAIAKPVKATDSLGTLHSTGMPHWRV
ncbi:hypothetical protein EJB05_48284, partial [Eragrostis curvula]